MTERTANTGTTPKLPPWLIIAIFLGLVVVSWWQTSNPPVQPKPETVTQQDSNPDETRDESRQPIPVQVSPESDEPQPRSVSQNGNSAPATQSQPKVVPRQATELITRIENQKIRDQDGHVVFSGTIDLQPTLDRIAHGDRNSHRNDGTVFQNRERKLPAKPSGYYKEYVHPTPKLSGPGPQRVIIGTDGDAWYTPDHYKTFIKIREKSLP